MSDILNYKSGLLCFIFNKKVEMFIFGEINLTIKEDKQKEKYVIK